MPVLIVLLIALVVLVNGTWGLYQKHEEALQKKREAYIELSKLIEQRKGLEEKIAFLQTDRGQEEQIRGKFMVVKEGENVIMVVDPKQSTTTLVAPKDEPSLWGRFLQLF